MISRKSKAWKLYTYAKKYVNQEYDPKLTILWIHINTIADFSTLCERVAFIPPLFNKYSLNALQKKKPFDDTNTFKGFIHELMPAWFSVEDKELIADMCLVIAQFRWKRPLQFYKSIFELFGNEGLFSYEQICTADAAKYWQTEYSRNSDFIHIVQKRYLFVSMVRDLYKHGYFLLASNQNKYEIIQNQLFIPKTIIVEAKERVEKEYIKLFTLYHDISDDEEDSKVFAFLHDKCTLESTRNSLRILKDAGYPISVEITNCMTPGEIFQALSQVGTCRQLPEDWSVVKK